MNPKEILADYVEAMHSRVLLENRVSTFTRSLGCEGLFNLDGIGAPAKTAYTKLVKQITPPELYDWCEWWMYECDFGTKNNMLIIDNKSYDANTLTLTEFLDLI